MFGSDFLGQGIKSLFGGVNSVVQTFSGSKKERDRYGHDQFINTQRTFSSEFHNRNNRTYWDSFWDGINRMPRPLFVVLIVGYFLLSYINPEEFQVLNIGLSTVPEKMWYVLSAIIGFYFCARELHKIRESKGMAIDQNQFKEMHDRIDSIRKQEKLKEQKVEEGFTEIYKDKSEAKGNLDNPSIEMWINNKNIKE